MSTATGFQSPVTFPSYQVLEDLQLGERCVQKVGRAAACSPRLELKTISILLTVFDLSSPFSGLFFNIKCSMFHQKQPHGSWSIFKWTFTGHLTPKESSIKVDPPDVYLDIHKYLVNKGFFVNLLQPSPDPLTRCL